MTIDIPKSPQLIAFQERRTQTQAKLVTDAAALARAEANVATWKERQSEAERAVAEQEAAEAERLSQWIADGEPIGVTLPNDVLSERLNGTKLNLSVAMKAAEHLRAVHRSTEAELATIESEIEGEASRLLDVQREALAEQVELAHGRLVEAIGELRALCPDELRSPMNAPRTALSVRVAAALALLPANGRDDLRTPLHLLRNGFHSAAELTAARAELISGSS